MLVNISRLVASYYTLEPSGPVSFGTSGHRGCAFNGTFNEMHIASPHRPFANIGYQKELTAPCTWVLTPMRYPRPHSGHLWKFFLPTAST
jgi:hypothetical protein